MSTVAVGLSAFAVVLASEGRRAEVTRAADRADGWVVTIYDRSANGSVARRPVSQPGPLGLAQAIHVAHLLITEEAF